MEFKELRPGEALPPPPAGEEKAFEVGGTCRLLVIRRGFFDGDACFYDVMRWARRPSYDWEPVISFSSAPIVACAFLRPDQILEEVRAKAAGDRGTARQPGPKEEAWVEGVAHGLADSAIADNEGLRPCPFCGEAPAAHMTGAWCSNDNCRMGWLATRTAWNTRPIEDRLRKELGNAERVLVAHESALHWHENNNFEKSQQIRRLQQAEAEAMALVMALEGRIETMENFISEAWGKEGEETLDTLRRVKEGREELKKWEEVKAHGKQIAQEMEAEACGGLTGVDPGDVDDLPTWAREDDPGDFGWARHMVCALIRWNLNFSSSEDFVHQHIREELQRLLLHIEQVTKGKEAKG